MTILVRRADESEISVIAAVHQEAFPRQIDSTDWVRATLAAYPRILAYVLILDDQVVGYVFWVQVSGIRRNAIIELDQVAILSRLRGQGLGEQLIIKSLELVKAQLSENSQTIKTLLVKTGSTNKAQNLYSRILGAHVVAEIEGLFSTPEVIMLAQVSDG